uniref:Uncharacterized protein n=1 Tax=Dunaliella tertiolecta TaxID=3047 RepID=A0A7S3R3Y8_DUNTE|mmetsp:Transcript_8021/g.21355  ORF Transcript_8021/g.21355 Transcript_8021/m.21355 type:complete len:487 (-) Transcript_8021:680-2140(-)
MDQILSHAISKCPFLGELARRNGDDYAKCIAINPTVPVDTGSSINSCTRRPVLEDYDSYETTFKAFHGPSGVCPLRTSAPPAACPKTGAVLSGGVPQLPQRREFQGGARQQLPHPSNDLPCSQGHHPLAAAPFATLSLSFGRNLPDFGKMLAKAMKQQPQAKPRNTRKPPGSNSSGSSARSGNRGKPSSRAKGPGSRGTIQQKGSSSGSPTGGGGQCPLRKYLGPVAPMIFNAKGGLQCPAPIIKARAMLASTEPVRLLRPQGLPAKLAAVGTTSMTVNVPCGMWREHCEKFSGHWFLAVHASIPFIAMLRKAVIMPKYAILFSIATAIAGQTIGSRMERRRIAPLKPTSFTLSSPIPTPSLVPSPAHTNGGVGISNRSGSIESSIKCRSGEGVRGRCCNSAQLAALEYFSTVTHGEHGEGGNMDGGVAREIGGQPPLTFTQAAGAAAGRQRAGLSGSRCGKASMMVSSQASAGLAAAPPALTIVS